MAYKINKIKSEKSIEINKINEKQNTFNSKWMDAEKPVSKQTMKLSSPSSTHGFVTTERV